MADMKKLASYLQEKRAKIDRAIDGYLPPATAEPAAIHACMRYSVAGGKRLRPILTLAVARLLRFPERRAMCTCAAIEFIHTHSLILDDLPCMDDDYNRRGRPASHAIFGESIALLAADALLNLAIALLGANHREEGVQPEIALEIIREVGETVGTAGMIGAQAVDLTWAGATSGGVTLERIHLGKTASLFSLSARAAALLAAARGDQIAALSAYGENLGLAFQIRDDILDTTGASDISTATHGRGLSEPNYARALGIETACHLATEATARAVAALDSFGPGANALRQLAQYNLTREV